MGCCQQSQTVAAYTQALAEIQEAAYAAVDAAADLVFEESSDDEDAKHKKNPDCLYLVFRDKDKEDHGVAFYRQGLGMTLTEWSDTLRVAGFYKTDVNEEASPAEVLGVQIGWHLVRIGHTDVSEMLPTDAVMILREKELCLMQHRSVKPWVQVIEEDKTKIAVEKQIVEMQAKHTVVKDAFLTNDPRGIEHEDDISIVAFHYPGFKTRVDRMCQASFLSNFYDTASTPFVVHDAYTGTEGKTFSNAECALLAMEVWGRAEELRYTGPEDARKVLISIKAGYSQGIQEPDHVGQDLGFPNRLKALLAVLRAKFAEESELGVALIGTGSSFLLYYPSDTEVPRQSRRSQRKSSKEQGVPVSESAFDEPGLTNTLGMLLMFIRYELGAEDGGWGEWLLAGCSISEILEDSTDSSVEFGKLAWNTAVMRCTRCVDMSLKRHKDPRTEKEKRDEARLSFEANKAQLAIPASGDAQEITFDDNEVLAEKNAERNYCRNAADAGISVYTPTWDLNQEAQLHEAREPKKPVSREPMATPAAPAPPVDTTDVNPKAAENFLGDALFSDAEMTGMPVLLPV